jgi:hypothetical protein
MGLLGSHLARRLDERGTDFTWHDTRGKVAAWPASTGIVYPSGTQREAVNYERWVGYAAAGFPEPDLVERCAYVFSTQGEPHGARHGQERVGALGISAREAIAVNVPAFVRRTRARYASRELQGCPQDARRVVAHGFAARLDRVLWGWAVPVRLTWDPALAAALQGRRPAVYLRKGRFVMAYAYPIPGTPFWWAGSSLITQRKPKPLAIEPKYLRWKHTVEALSDGMVHIVGRGGLPVHGWRPAPARQDTALVRDVDGVPHIRPMWNDGLRNSPDVIDAMLAAVPHG